MSESEHSENWLCIMSDFSAERESVFAKQWPCASVRCDIGELTRQHGEAVSFSFYITHRLLSRR